MTPANSSSTPIVVGVAGGSSSGKTTLARTLVREAKGAAFCLSFDNYYLDQGHLPPAERALVNYDHPDSLDVAQFAADLAQLRSGEAVEIPTYDFATNTRTAATERVQPMPLILVDGILLLLFAEIRASLHLSVFVDASDDVRTERRIVRDVAERGRTREYALEQIERTVRPMFDAFVLPSRCHADLTIDGTAPAESSAQLVREALGQRGYLPLT